MRAIALLLLLCSASVACAGGPYVRFDSLALNNPGGYDVVIDGIGLFAHLDSSAKEFDLSLLGSYAGAVSIESVGGVYPAADAFRGDPGDPWGSGNGYVVSNQSLSAPSIDDLGIALPDWISAASSAGTTVFILGLGVMLGLLVLSIGSGWISYSFLYGGLGKGYTREVRDALSHRG